MSTKLLLLYLALPCALFGQARLVMTGNSYIVIDNGAKLYLENGSANAIVSSGSGGIMTEGEMDQVIWNIGTGTGTYTMPFVSQAAITQIPFTADITGAGSGAGSIRFSTWPGALWDNNSYRPSDVTHMYDYNTNSINNSAHVIDRFWVVDAQGYSTRPSATFSFTYRDAEHVQAGNAIIEANLAAQRFNSGTGQWGDYLPQGVTNTATNVTSGVPVVPANFFRSWTLSETTNPLSAEVTWFSASCTGDKVQLGWQTFSEAGTDHFEIEHYTGTDFAVEGFVQPEGAGHTYMFSPQSLRSGIFRLIEVTENGTRIVRSSVSANCGSKETFASYDAASHTLVLSFEAQSDAVEDLALFDAAGKLVMQLPVQLVKGYNTYSIPEVYLSQAMYVVSLRNGTESVRERFLAY
jgi:hypothetical protein